MSEEAKRFMEIFLTNVEQQELMKAFDIVTKLGFTITMNYENQGGQTNEN